MPWLWLPVSSWMKTLRAVDSTLSRLWIAVGFRYPPASASWAIESVARVGSVGFSTSLNSRPFGNGPCVPAGPRVMYAAPGPGSARGSPVSAM